MINRLVTANQPVFKIENVCNVLLSNWQYIPNESNISREKTTVNANSGENKRASGRGGWNKSLILLASAVFMLSLGGGLQSGISTNFMKELGLSGAQVLLQSGIRELPGLCLMFIAALTFKLSLTWRAAASVLIMGVGYALYAAVHSWTALVIVSLTASLGFHLWLPLNTSLGLVLADKQNAGKVLGTLSAVAALASMVGIGCIIAFSNLLSLRLLAGVAGILIIVAAILISRLPKKLGETIKAQPRLLFRRRYWLYYVLLLFEGSRAQVFFAFNIMVLVYNYGLSAMQVSFLMLASGLVNFLFARRLGTLLDVTGERITLTLAYLGLALCFVGYALVHNVWFLGFLVVCINLIATLSIGLSTYVSRITPPEELTATLSTGVSVNHISSVGMSLLAGALLPVVGYQALCWAVVVIVSLSVPFAMQIRTHLPQITLTAEK
jgi:predicted MFS family arabinose efflux permease